MAEEKPKPTNVAKPKKPKPIEKTQPIPSVVVKTPPAAVVVRPQTSMTWMDRAFIVGVLLAIGATGAWWLRESMPVPAVITHETHLDSGELATAIINGLMLPIYDRDPETGMPRPWPENQEISQARFHQDCIDVCMSTRAYRSSRDEEDTPEPRILYEDYEHLVCTCFTGHTVFRYVGWERRSP